MEPSPANEGFTDRHEGLVDVIAFVESGPEPAELMQQRNRLLNHVSEDAQSAAMGRAATGDLRLDSFARQLLAMRIAIVAAIGHDALGLLQGRARNAFDRRDRLD